MKNDKLIFIFLILAILIIIAGFFGIRYLKEKQVSSEIEEYTPQEEITDDQMKKTMVTLYFYNNETGELESESRVVDAINLVKDPYTWLVQLLIDGPKNEKLKSLLPDDVKVISSNIENGCVTLDMSIELLNHTEDKDLKNKMIYSIVNTLTELNEVESLKFTINGKPNEAFSEEYIRI